VASGTWQLEPCSYGDVRALAAELSLDEITASVLVRRGYGSPGEARRFLEGALPGHDPFALGDMREAVETIAAAVEAGARICVHGDYDGTKLKKLVAYLAHKYYRAPVDTEVVGATTAGPEFTTPKSGLAVNTKTMRAALAQLLQDSHRAPLELLTRPLPAKTTPSNFGPVIVITRGANSLVLYDGTQVVGGGIIEASRRGRASLPILAA